MNKKRAFITGIAGFAGTYLAEELLNHNYKVTGTIYKGDPPENIKKLKNKVEFIRLDILNQKKCEQVIKKCNPEYIFHLAAFSSVGRSFENERLTYKINIRGTLNFLEAALNIKKFKKFIFISSSECYGRFSPKGKILTETEPLNPISPYAISKTTAEQICRLYFERYQLPVTIARSFNHSGPGQNDNFVIPAFCKKTAMIEKGLTKPILLVGNPKIKRDISDVRDIVRGYRLMAEKGKAGRAYQLCSGQSATLLNILRKLQSFSDKKFSIKIDKNFARKNDIITIKGSNARAKRELGFKINFKLDDTLLDCLNYYRNKLKD